MFILGLIWCLNFIYSIPAHIYSTSGDVNSTEVGACCIRFNEWSTPVFLHISAFIFANPVHLKSQLMIVHTLLLVFKCALHFLTIQSWLLFIAFRADYPHC